MLLLEPVTFAKDFQTGTVHNQLHWFVTLGLGLWAQRQPIATARQGGKIRHCDRNPQQPRNRAHQALGLTQRLLEDQAQRQTQLDCQIRVVRLSATRRAAWCRPQCKCVFAEPAVLGEPISDLLTARFGSLIEVTIPPPKNALLSLNAAKDPTVRDRHIADVAARGRMAWQKATGYNQRSRGETLMGRWKGVIEPKLKARTFENQKTEAKIGVRVLNRMTGLGHPSFERTA